MDDVLELVVELVSGSEVVVVDDVVSVVDVEVLVDEVDEVLLVELVELEDVEELDDEDVGVVLVVVVVTEHGIGAVVVEVGHGANVSLPKSTAPMARSPRMSPMASTH